MSAENNCICPSCKKTYTLNNPPRLLTMCGHTYCQNCIKVLIVKKKQGSYRLTCPQDNIKIELDSPSPSFFPKNAIVEEMSSKRRRISIDDLGSKNQFLLSDRVNQQDNETHAPEGTRRKSLEGKPEEDGVCRVHQKCLDIVCMVDKIKICPQCALFGQHKGHYFMSIKDLEHQKRDHCDKILSVVERKTSIQSKIHNQDIRSEIMNLLEEKKKTILAQAKLNFELLIKEVNQVSAKFQTALEEKLLETTSKLQLATEINPKILERYSVWEDRALNQIKTIQGDSFKKCVEVMGNKNKLAMLLQNGEKLIRALKKQENGLMQKVESIINEVKISADKIVYDSIQFYLRTEAVEAEKEEDEENEDCYSEAQIAMEGGEVGYASELKEKSSLQNAENRYVSQIATPLAFQKPRSKKSVLKPKISNRLLKPINLNGRDSLRSSIKEGGFQSSRSRNTSMYRKSFLDRSSATNLNQSAKAKADKRMFPIVKDPERYEKNILGLEKDTLEIIDFNNSELGDNITMGVLELIKKASLPKCIRLVKNKLTDQATPALIDIMNKVDTLVLCQNQLTDQFLEKLIETVKQKPFLTPKSIYMGGNMLNLRRIREKVDELKLYNVSLTL